MSFPMQEASPAPADHSGMNPLTYSDPTGDAAIRHLLNSGGPFTITAMNGFHAMVNAESLEYMMLGMTARIARTKKNRAGKMRAGLLWLVPTPTQKNTPTAGSNANPNCSEGSNIEIDQKEYQR